MGERFILAIDQGTTGTKIVIYDEKARIISQSYREITCYYLQPGWVEHNPQIFSQEFLFAGE